ncbi:unnamed protein product, partial [Phaeothamnion confervicola]
NGAAADALTYPSNLTLANIFWFWFAPTLCYQLNYPQTKSIDWRYVLSLVVRIVTFGVLMIVIIEQYIMPTVQESMASLASEKRLESLEKLLTLGVPSTYLWLIGFYAFFHCWLNLLAELLRFGDRIFYRDWWNAKSFSEFWRNWNLPVHYFLVRHLYFPLLRAGCGKNVAQMACFLLSAVVHEVLISTPFRMVRFYAFAGMIGNIPLVPITDAVQRFFGPTSQAGNFAFWTLFCIIGQPMSLLFYYRDYCKENKCSLLLAPGGKH